jgi:hypothetical protein
MHVTSVNEGLEELNNCARGCHWKRLPLETIRDLLPVTNCQHLYRSHAHPQKRLATQYNVAYRG